MVRKLIWWLVLFPASVLLVVLAVANRHMVTFVLDPFSPQTPALAVELPFFVYLFGALLSGLVLGSVATWLGQSKWRRTARRDAREAHEWRAQAERLSKQRIAVEDPQQVLLRRS